MGCKQSHSIVPVTTVQPPTPNNPLSSSNMPKSSFVSSNQNKLVVNTEEAKGMRSKMLLASQRFDSSEEVKFTDKRPSNQILRDRCPPISTFAKARGASFNLPALQSNSTRQPKTSFPFNIDSGITVLNSSSKELTSEKSKLDQTKSPPQDQPREVDFNRMKTKPLGGSNKVTLMHSTRKNNSQGKLNESLLDMQKGSQTVGRLGSHNPHSRVAFANSMIQSFEKGFSFEIDNRPHEHKYEEDTTPKILEELGSESGVDQSAQEILNHGSKDLQARSVKSKREANKLGTGSEYSGKPQKILPSNLQMNHDRSRAESQTSKVVYQVHKFLSGRAISECDETEKELEKGSLGGRGHSQKPKHNLSISENVEFPHHHRLQEKHEEINDSMNLSVDGKNSRVNMTFCNRKEYTNQLDRMKTKLLGGMRPNQKLNIFEILKSKSKELRKRVPSETVKSRTKDRRRSKSMRNINMRNAPARQSATTSKNEKEADRDRKAFEESKIRTHSIGNAVSECQMLPHSLTQAQSPNLQPSRDLEEKKFANLPNIFESSNRRKSLESISEKSHSTIKKLFPTVAKTPQHSLQHRQQNDQYHQQPQQEQQSRTGTGSIGWTSKPKLSDEIGRENLTATFKDERESMQNRSERKGFGDSRSQLWTFGGGERSEVKHISRTSSIVSERMFKLHQFHLSAHASCSFGQFPVHPLAEASVSKYTADQILESENGQLELSHPSLLSHKVDRPSALPESRLPQSSPTNTLTSPSAAPPKNPQSATFNITPAKPLSSISPSQRLLSLSPLKEMI